MSQLYVEIMQNEPEKTTSMLQALINQQRVFERHVRFLAQQLPFRTAAHEQKDFDALVRMIERYPLISGEIQQETNQMLKNMFKRIKDQKDAK